MLASYTRGGWVAGIRILLLNDIFLSLNSLNSAKKFRKNSIVANQLALSHSSREKTENDKENILRHLQSPNSPVVHPKFPTRGEIYYLLFDKHFAKNCIKIKDSGPAGGGGRGGGAFLAPPLIRL